ncbi:MAG: hypothetical protein LDL31_03200 [Prosthecobacter sp.]|nr:hypothetical protein [Prosthecobacter sp.]
MDWNELIQKHLSGLATEAESRQLAAELKTNDALADLYVKHIALDVALECKADATDSARALITTPVSRTQTPWYAWRPLTAAAAGIVLGILCTSVVFGYVTERASQGLPIPVFDPGFEGAKPLDTGLPHGADEWGGRSVAVVPAENGVRPLNGRQMLRLQPSELNEKDANHYAHAYQVLDLRPLALGVQSGAMEVLVSASFCTAPSSAKARNCIRIYALKEPPASVTENFWSKDEDAGVISLTQRFEIASGDDGWRVFSAKMPLPQGTQSLVIIFSATSPKLEPPSASASYLDDVQAILSKTPDKLHP